MLVTGTDRKPGYLKGLTEGKINIRFRANSNNLAGSFVELSVTAANGLSLEGSMSPVRIASLITE